MQCNMYYYHIFEFNKKKKNGDGEGKRKKDKGKDLPEIRRRRIAWNGMLKRGNGLGPVFKMDLQVTQSAKCPKGLR